jgi:hypothetical protein
MFDHFPVDSTSHLHTLYCKRFVRLRVLFKTYINHLEKNRRLQEAGECSTTIDFHEVWKTIWKMQVPTITKNFLWKICNNLLPAKENLFRKNIAQVPLCPFCQADIETTGHILWSYPSSMAAWQECSRRI